MTIVHDNTNGGINCGKGDLIIQAGGNNGDGVIIQTGTTHIAKFEKHSSTGLGNFELLYNGSTRIISQSWGTEIKNGELRVNDNDIIAFYASDINLKENFEIIPNALDKVGLMTGYTFKWKDDISGFDYFKGKADTGVIAQDVEALGLPGISTTRDDGTKAIRYERLVPILIEAIKELTDRVKALESS